MINEQTGLPEVGPRQFWRIRRAATNGYSYVQLRLKLPLGSIMLGEEIFASYGVRRESVARGAAESVLREYVAKFTPDPFYGDYPPNRLGDQ